VVAVFILGSMLVMAALVVALDALLKPAEARRAAFRRVARYADDSEVRPAIEVERPRLREILVPALGKVARRLTPRGDFDGLALRLEAAGLTDRLDAESFLALKTILAAGGVVIGFLAAGLSVGGFLLAVVLATASLYVPDMIVKRMARARANRLTRHLPQVIDQIAISLEAGLAFDAAVAYFVRKSRSPLVDELRLLLSQIRMGDSRAQALNRLAERVPSDEMRTFVQTLVQSDGIGMSRAAILRSQANDLRLQRQLAAEERAHRVPIHILFPTVLFIFPPILIVILGPALQQIATLLHHH
jgi:tight adherence protein C